MAGINKYEGKDKRRQRLRNHIVRDLRTPKYGQKVIPSARKIGGTDDERWFDWKRYDDETDG